ncbi:MAG: hypothetical protein H7067_00460 [Burkholderiales bacterium]|nr:hypothetical protein [Opitutaceae bacterium]
MPPVFTPEQLGPVFPEFAGFRHMASGGFKSVYHISRRNGAADEVLKIVCLQRTKRITLTFEQMDAILEAILRIARNRSDV